MTTRDHCINCGGDIVYASVPEYRCWLHVGSGRMACRPPRRRDQTSGDFATPRRTVGDSADLDARDAGQRAADGAR